MKKLLIPAAALVLAVGPAWADDSESRTTVLRDCSLTPLNQTARVLVQIRLGTTSVSCWDGI